MCTSCLSAKEAGAKTRLTSKGSDQGDEPGEQKENPKIAIMNRWSTGALYRQKVLKRSKRDHDGLIFADPRVGADDDVIVSARLD